MSDPGLTRALGAFVSSLTPQVLPPDALDVIRIGFADCLGVMIAGRAEPAPMLLQQALAPPPGPASLMFGADTAPAPEAAWINGTAAHALDFDDVGQRGHPSTVLVPAILAEGQALGASGARMAAAYAAGYEVWAELVQRDPDQHHNKGWHPTAIFGAIGAAAACASLRRLDVDQTTMALALGASQSAGLMANFGSMTKPFHAGRAAHAGVISARLAQAGFTGAVDALEHPQGFLSAVSPAGRVDRDRPSQAGRTWQLPIGRLSIKKYPLCFCTHRALDGMLDLLAEHPLRAEDVAAIRVRTSRRNATILRNDRPRTGLEAKFSMQFAMACAIVAGRAGLAELTDAFVQRPDVQSLIARTEVDADDIEDPARPGYAMFDQIVLRLADGRELRSRQITGVRGDATLPLTRDELRVKFEGCAEVGGFAPARPLFDALMALETLADANHLPGLSRA